MIRAILLVSMSFVLITSVLAPAAILLSDVKFVMLDGIESSEEETNSSENEVYEKELIDHKYFHHELFLFSSDARMNGLSKDYILKRASDVFLPPPEHI